MKIYVLTPTGIEETHARISHSSQYCPDYDLSRTDWFFSFEDAKKALDKERGDPMKAES